MKNKYEIRKRSKVNSSTMKYHKLVLLDLVRRKISPNKIDESEGLFISVKKTIKLLGITELTNENLDKLILIFKNSLISNTHVAKYGFNFSQDKDFPKKPEAK